MFPLRDSVARSRDPVVVWAIIALNIAVFGYQLTLSGREEQIFLFEHALVPLRYFSPSWAAQHGLSPLDVTPFLTNTFMHGGWLHIILNLWTLYIFGPALEDRLGPARFLALYLAAAVIASATHAVFNATSPIPALGASGAIAGVIGAYAVRFPYAWVRVLVPIFIFPLFFSIPALMFAGIWFFFQVLQGTGELFLSSTGGVAWWAHIGGFLAGVFLLGPLQPQSGSAAAGGPWANRDYERQFERRAQLMGPGSGWWSSR
ncbi:MAG TPA: rhomboid family intramembrane serine protease [Hyphomicrobiaceae bacterium]|nr:rhomboid family intramembrane serine protease [Hyphomicrobiaceae bacterium]